MNNPFGLPDEVMNAIIASATKNMMSGCRAGGVRPNPFEPPTSKQNDTLAEDAAKMAKDTKKIYDSFVTVGFNDVQAFELLKLALSRR